MSIWNMIQKDENIAINFNANDETGAVTGSIAVKDSGLEFSNVTGEWKASGTGKGIVASAFSFIAGGAENYISGAGVMNGPGNAPVSVDIQVNFVSGDSGSTGNASGTLFPRGS